TRRASFRSTFVTSFPSLEDVLLECFGRLPEEPAGGTVVPALEGEVAPRRPRERGMADGGKVGEALLGGGEGLLGLVEAALSHEGAAEDDRGHADLGQVVDAAVEDLERVARVALRRL